MNFITLVRLIKFKTPELSLPHSNKCNQFYIARNGDCKVVVPNKNILRVRVSKAKGMKSVWEGGVSFFEELCARDERARE